jgi:ribosomal protein S18 acetylase RimI-like enzyme
MELSIKKGNYEHLDDCASILEDSILGQKYFLDQNNQYIGQKLLKEGFDKGEIYVALDEEGQCIGFAWIILNGIFHWFPFLHVLAVKKAVRGNGVGKQLMGLFEEIGFVQDKSDKLFLCVDDFSIEAMGLYKALGYEEIGPIPDMYVPGVVTYLMMKKSSID